MTNPSVDPSDSHADFTASEVPNDPAAADSHLPTQSDTEYVSMGTQTSITSQSDLDPIDLWSVDDVEMSGAEPETVETAVEPLQLSRSRPQSTRNRHKELADILARYGSPLRDSAERISTGIGFQTRFIADATELLERQAQDQLLNNNNQQPNTCGAQHLSANHHHYDPHQYDP